MSNKINAMHLFDAEPMRLAKQAVEHARSITEKDLEALGAQKFAHIEYRLNDEAQLEALQRFVKDSALKKVFGDGEVVGAIDDVRVASVQFYRMPDGVSGVAIANLSGGTRAMEKLLEVADLNDLNLQPSPPQFPNRKPKTAKKAKLSIGDQQTIEVEIKEEPIKEAPASPGFSSRGMQAMGAPMMANIQHHPLAFKMFLKESWTSPQQNIPAPRAEDMIAISILAATTKAHPDDEVWPDGISVRDVLNNKDIEGPKQAIKLFSKALKHDEGEMDRDDIKAQLKSRKKPGM